MNYIHTAARTEEERNEQRKAARLSLDTSVHGGSRFDQLLKQLERERPRKIPAGSGMRAVQSMGALKNMHMATSAPSGFGGLSAMASAHEEPESSQRGTAFFPALKNVPKQEEAPTAAPMDVEERGHGRSAAYLALAQAGAEQPKEDGQPAHTHAAAGPSNLALGITAVPMEEEIAPTKVVKRVNFQEQVANARAAAAGSSAMQFESAEGSMGGSGAVMTPHDLEALMRNMQFKQNQAMSKGKVLGFCNLPIIPMYDISSLRCWRTQGGAVLSAEMDNVIGEY